MQSRPPGRFRPFAALALAAVAAALAFAHAASAAGPSAHCHVTDGVFTTCPDGSAEWSDVPSKSFPHAHLYADEADLDPSLRSSPTNPADTLMLMYDECGRRQPLGPNEPFVVSFATVEDAEGGKHELNHYVIHVFTDGTIVFLENGSPVKDEAGDIRSEEIEGQRGKASFGPSPSCSFDHVIAEFEIKLSVTGLTLTAATRPTRSSGAPSRRTVRPSPSTTRTSSRRATRSRRTSSETTATRTTASTRAPSRSPPRRRPAPRPRTATAPSPTRRRRTTASARPTRTRTRSPTRRARARTPRPSRSPRAPPGRRSP